MEQPKGYVVKGREGYVWRLNKALYGLKQSARSWNDNLKRQCITTGFIQSPADECGYIRNRGENDICIFYLHVEDLAITRNNIVAFKEEISSFWPMEDLGLAHCLVGIQTSRVGTNHYSLSQTAMTRSILARFGLTDCKQALTPLPGGLKMTLTSNKEANDFARRDLPYRSGVGSPMYLSQCKQPKFSYAVGCLPFSKTGPPILSTLGSTQARAELPQRLH